MSYEMIFSDTETESAIYYDPVNETVRFELRNTNSFTMYINEWVAITRLTNALWLGGLLDRIPGLCYNPICQMGYSGGHQKTPGCPPFADWLRLRNENEQRRLRELQVSSGRPIPPVGQTGDNTLPYSTS